MSGHCRPPLAWKVDGMTSLMGQIITAWKAHNVPYIDTGGTNCNLSLCIVKAHPKRS
jgi:hypothetical protein